MVINRGNYRGGFDRKTPEQQIAILRKAQIEGGRQILSMLEAGENLIQMCDETEGMIHQLQESKVRALREGNIANAKRIGRAKVYHQITLNLLNLSLLQSADMLEGGIEYYFRIENRLNSLISELEK